MTQRVLVHFAATGELHSRVVRDPEGGREKGRQNLEFIDQITRKFDQMIINPNLILDVTIGKCHQVVFLLGGILMVQGSNPQFAAERPGRKKDQKGLFLFSFVLQK